MIIQELNNAHSENNLRIGSLAWLGYRTHTAGVAGSNPARSIDFLKIDDYHEYLIENFKSL